MSMMVKTVGTELTGNTSKLMIKALANTLLGSGWSYEEEGNIAWCEKAGMGFSFVKDSKYGDGRCLNVIATKKDDEHFKLGGTVNYYGANIGTTAKYDIDIVIYTSPNGSVAFGSKPLSDSGTCLPALGIFKTENGYVGLVGRNNDTNGPCLVHSDSTSTISCLGSWSQRGARMEGASSYILLPMGDPFTGETIKDLYLLYGQPESANTDNNNLPNILTSGSKKFIKIVCYGGYGTDTVLYMRYL